MDSRKVDRPSLFDGTWRPDPQRAADGAPPEQLRLADGVFACLSCDPPYDLPVDGREHRLRDHPRFDVLAVTVLDERTVRRIGRRAGSVVRDTTTLISSNGEDRVDRFDAVMDGRALPLETRWVRVGSPTTGAHLVSGSWREIETDLVNHDEDTDYRIVDDVLEMHDRLGRSFRAPLDGSAVPYLGDSRYTTVSVRWLDDRTIEESDRNGEHVAFRARWRVDDDGETMHVQFDDLKGHVMEQSGHRLP